MTKNKVLIATDNARQTVLDAIKLASDNFETVTGLDGSCLRFKIDEHVTLSIGHGSQVNRTVSVTVVI